MRSEGSRPRRDDHGKSSAPGPASRYRLYVVHGYDIAVRVPGVGVARPPKQAIAADEHRALDIPLAHRANFQGGTGHRSPDRESPSRANGLWHWQRPGIEARRDANGVIRDPGPSARVSPVRGRSQVGYELPGRTKGVTRVGPAPEVRQPRRIMAAQLRLARLRRERPGCRRSPIMVDRGGEGLERDSRPRRQTGRRRPSHRR